jgi:ribosomal protein S18 acetylase RimI-like enzyme
MDLKAELVTDALAKEFLEDYCELSNAYARLSADKGVVGVVAWYPSSDFGSYKKASLHHMLSHLSSDDASQYLARLKLLRAEIPPLPPSQYLALLAVRCDMRGTGVADQLLWDFPSKPASRDYSLHVASDNSRAINFYRKHEFSFLEPTDKLFKVMLRKGYTN